MPVYPLSLISHSLLSLLVVVVVVVVLVGWWWRSNVLTLCMCKNEWLVTGVDYFLFPWVQFIYSCYRVSYPAIKWTGRGFDHPILTSAGVKEVIDLYSPPRQWAIIDCFIVVYLPQMFCFLSCMLVTLTYFICDCTEPCVIWYMYRDSCTVFYERRSKEGGVGFCRKYRSWNHLTVCSLQKVNCPEVKASKLITSVENDKSDFADSFYGLTNFRLIFIRNYIFQILVRLYLFRKMAQPFSLIQRVHVGR